MKTKALICFAVTAKLICVFVFAYAKCWFSHDAAHFSFTHFHVCKAAVCIFIMFILLLVQLCVSRNPVLLSSISKQKRAPVFAGLISKNYPMVWPVCFLRNHE